MILRPILRVLLAAAVVLGLGAEGARAIDWMINEDYKQTDPRGATDFDILLQGQVPTDATGSGPYRFIAADFNAGEHSAYERFADYLPRGAYLYSYTARATLPRRSKPRARPRPRARTSRSVPS